MFQKFLRNDAYPVSIRNDLQGESLPLALKRAFGRIDRFRIGRVARNKKMISALRPEKMRIPSRQDVDDFREELNFRYLNPDSKS